MRKALFGAATTAAFLAGATLAPAAYAAEKFEFAGVDFPDGTIGKIQASTKEMNKKPDYIYCYYATPEWQPLGYYGQHLEPAPADADDVLAFCLEHYGDRWQ